MGDTWQTGRGSAIATFDTDKFGTITISIDAFVRNPDLWTIDKTSPNYHEYGSDYPTGINPWDASQTSLRSAVKNNPTPIPGATEFAGPGYIFDGAPSGATFTVNVTEPLADIDSWHLLNPGVVQRDLVLDPDGTYHITTKGIGVGNFQWFNSQQWIIDPVWDYAAKLAIEEVTSPSIAEQLNGDPDNAVKAVDEGGWRGPSRTKFFADMSSPYYNPYIEKALANKPRGYTDAEWAAAVNRAAKDAATDLNGPEGHGLTSPAAQPSRPGPAFETHGRGTPTYSDPRDTGNTYPGGPMAGAAIPGRETTTNNPAGSSQGRGGGPVTDPVDRALGGPAATKTTPSTNTGGADSHNSASAGQGSTTGGGGSDTGAANNRSTTSSGQVRADAISGGVRGTGGTNAAPILLDMAGTGIAINELTSSNRFMDAEGSGLLHRTAWAGAGTGVLFYDPLNEGAIVRNDQYIFTEWDPTAKGDLEALRTVFDSNGDGVFTAADARFAQFKIEVTNADGTTSVMTLAQAGITSISLKADLTHVQYADGSAITGQATFTRSNGTAGTVANTTLASESAGYAATRVVTTDASASRVVTSTAYAADGSIAEVVKTVTSPTGNSITTSFDTNGDGVWDKVQAILTSTVSGVKTEVLTNKNGGNVLLDSKQTITSADGRAATGKARHIVPVARCELRARRASEPPGQTSVSDADVMTMARGKFERRNSLYGWRDYAMAPTVARAPGMAYRSLKLAGAR